MKNVYKMIALCGKSGSGKDTIIKSVLDNCPPDLVNKKISFTTRPKRDYEVNGEDYYFVTNEYFLKNIDNFIEVTNFRGWYYGTMRSPGLDINKINIGTFDLEGIRIIKEANLVDLDYVILYVDAKDSTRLIRCLSREQEPDIEEVFRRYNADELDFYDIDEHADINLVNETEENLKYITNYIKEIIYAWVETGEYNDKI